MKAVPEQGRALVLFGATWCMPWRILERQLGELASVAAAVVTVDVDAQPGLADSHNIVSLPCAVLFDDAREARRVTGAFSIGELVALVRDTPIEIVTGPHDDADTSDTF